MWWIYCTFLLKLKLSSNIKLIFYDNINFHIMYIFLFSLYFIDNLNILLDCIIHERTS